MSIFRIFWSLPFVFLLNGCMDYNLIKPAEQVNKGVGVILASVTKDGGFNGWFFYRKKGTEKEMRMDAVHSGDEISDKFLTNNKTKGRLLAIKATPGDYELTKWILYAPLPLGGYQYISLDNFTPLPFSIESGKITYLGNLHLKMLTGKNFVGVSVPSGAVSKISNESKRDLFFLKEKYPNLKDWQIKIQIPNGNIWSK